MASGSIAVLDGRSYGNSSILAADRALTNCELDQFFRCDRNPIPVVDMQSVRIAMIGGFDPVTLCTRHRGRVHHVSWERNARLAPRRRIIVSDVVRCPCARCGDHNRQKQGNDDFDDSVHSVPKILLEASR
jgi:hypothetical protein